MVQTWAGYAYNISTTAITTARFGAGFSTTGLTFANANLGASVTQVISYKQAEQLFLGKQSAAAANPGGGILDRTMNYLGNVATAAGMTLDWALGTGSDNRTFINDNVAKAFMNANRVNEARNFYYNKYSGAKSLLNTSVTGYKGSFGLSGLWNAGLDPIEQFVGTYRINIYNFSGNTLWFVLTNQTSMNSFLYDLGPSWQRSTWGPGGNMNQTYIWNEPVRK